MVWSQIQLGYWKVLGNLYNGWKQICLNIAGIFSTILQFLIPIHKLKGARFDLQLQLMIQHQKFIICPMKSYFHIKSVQGLGQGKPHIICIPWLGYVAV